MRKILLPLLLLAFLAAGTQAQTRLTGTIVEVIDGRTMVLDTNAGRITARLQFIETPEPEQPLHATVRDHLSKLTAGKTIEFVPSRMVERVTIVRAMADGVDLSAQLIRDGAAWHEPANSSGQPQNEAAEYANNQQLAKNEKRGVWSIADLRTPWEIRAERQAALDRADRERRAVSPSKVGLSPFQTESRAGPDSQFKATRVNDDRQLGISASIFTGKANEAYGLHTETHPRGYYTVVYSSPSFLELTGGQLKFKVEYRLAYYISKVPHRFGSEWYVLYVRSMKDEYKFEKRRSALMIAADGRNVPVGRPYVGATSDRGFGTHEVFFYKLTRAQVLAMAKASSVQLKIDGLTGSVDRETLALFKELAATMK